MKKRQTGVDRIFDVCNIVFMAVMMLLWIYPMWYCVIRSVSNTAVVSAREVWIVPKAFTWANYRTVFEDSRILNSFWLSVRITLLGSMMNVFLNACAAYALSKARLMGRKWITTVILISMYFSGGLIPWYILMVALGMLNNFWGFILPYLYAGSTIIIMRSFFKAIPDEMEESAKIDGANDLLIFIQIYLPLSGALLATMFLFAAVGKWNNWFTGDILMTKDNLKPLSTVLMEIVNRNKLDSNLIADTSGKELLSMFETPSAEGVKMAAVLVTTIPILCVYPFLQKHFAKGVMIGSVKG